MTEAVVATAAMNSGLISTGSKRKIMVVADPCRESVGALEWALYHAVVEQDEIILLHVETGVARRPSPLSAFLCRPPSVAASPGLTVSASLGSGPSYGSCDEYEFLDAMRTRCATVQPKLKVQLERVEMKNKDKATTILTQTKVLQADLLVIGQRRSPTSFLGRKLTGSMSNKGIDVAEFLIENSSCLCVGVQKKGQNAGYLLNTKTHKNFWLLA